MVDASTVSVGLETLGALAAAVAWWRVRRLTGLVDEPRLRRLAHLFAFLAAAILVHLLGVLLFLANPAIPRDALGLQDALFWLHHGLLLAGLASGVLAVGPHRRGQVAAALASVLLLAEPLLRGLEAILLLYLAVRTTLNHVRRTNLGSLQVAVGLVLLLAAHVTYLLAAAPLGPRDPVGEALALAGLLVLALAPPGLRRRR